MSNSQSRGDVRIVGQAACPVCQIREGSPNGESRANLGSDGRVSCVLCARVSTTVPAGSAAVYTLPEVVRNTVLALISSNRVDDVTFRIAGITTGDGYGAYHLGGSIDSILTTISLSNGQFNFERIELSFCESDLKYALAPSREIGQDFDRKSVGCRVPVSIDQAAQRLLAEGYRFVGATIGATMRSLRFVKGSAITGTKAIAGLSATISWIAE
jgi:hypothetical protein